MPYQCNFYPRPPRGGRRTTAVCSPRVSRFLSTPSARRATLQDRRLQLGKAISIHALREEGDPLRFPASYLQSISIHALREEGDLYRQLKKAYTVISIHALREEGDLLLLHPVSPALDFYPRPPRGGRRALSSLMVRLMLFLSTPSARRATCGSKNTCTSKKFLSTPSARRAT